MFRIIAIACLGLGLSALTAQARPVQGSLTYLARSALPAGAEIVIEARGLQDTLLAETRFKSGGKQVPLAFTLTLPDAVNATIRAVIVTDGRPVWVSDAIPVPAGDAAVDLGEVLLGAYQPMGFATTLRCGDTRLRVGFFEDRAVLETDTDRLILSQMRAASGARFELPDDPQTYYWSRGDMATVSLQGNVLPDCMAVPPEPDQPYRARGTEPFWSLTIAGGVVELIPNIGETPVQARLPQASLEGADFVFDMAAAGIVLRLSERLCHDLMAGTPYPQTVSVSWDGTDLQGCGGESIDLIAGPVWEVAQIDGTDLTDQPRPRLEFDAVSALLSGDGSCNSYTAAFDLSGEGLSIGPAMVTRMACPEPVMAQENRFFDILRRITRFDIGADGALQLYANDRQDPLVQAVAID